MARGRAPARETLVKRPNLLFVFSDQHRYHDLGCNGNLQVRSPCLDALADRSVRFTSCISNNPVCVPMRGSLLTGQFAWKHRAITNDLPIDVSMESIATVLGRAGYRTGYIGKWHLGGIPRTRAILAHERLGFQEWKAANCNHDYWNGYYWDEANVRHPLAVHESVGQTDLALDFVRSHASDAEPWALFLSWGPPHDPYDKVPAEYAEMYREEELSLRPNVLERIARGKTVVGREWARRSLAGYYALVSLLDHEMGRLIDGLETAGIVERTVVVYTSDHGDMLGSHGYANKQLPWEESIRVPLLVSWPGTVTPRVCRELIGLVDLPVTLLGLLGLSFGGPTDGTDLHDLLLKPDARGLDVCYIFDQVPCHQAEDQGSPAWKGVRTRTQTYSEDDQGRPWLVYDNAADPFQERNLARDPAFASALAALQGELGTLIARYGDLRARWQDMLRVRGLVEAWNASQRHFGREPLKPA